MSDDEWAYVGPRLPPAPKDGRKEKHDRRDIVDAILYVTHNGVVWRALPADFPLWKTVYGFFDRWKKRGSRSGSTTGCVARSAVPRAVLPNRPPG